MAKSASMKYLFLLLPLFVFISCDTHPEEGAVSSNNADTALATAYYYGKKIMETQCYTCHNPSAAAIEGRIAPPMVAIKAHYLKKYDTEESFVSAISDFVANPNEAHALMSEEIQKYGLMPKQSYPGEAVKTIASFMYRFQIEEPTWFAAQWAVARNGQWVQPGTKFMEVEQEESYADVGLKYALSTKKVLGKNLMEAIQKEGAMEALLFCNVQAIPLTDSMSAFHHAFIKRVSDKPRNPNNKADAAELAYIAEFKKQLLAQQSIQPLVVDRGDKVQVYYPIETNTMCLQCHGAVADIKPDVAKKILALYPDDAATGYAENEVRGIWSIVFDKEKRAGK